MVGTFGQAVLVAAALLGVGLVLRLSVGLLRALYIPASVVAGVLGLLWIQTAGHVSAPLGAFAVRMAGEWASWPGTLIAVVFAGLLLEAPAPGGFAQAMRRGVRSGILAWIIILGQIAIGLVVYLVAIRPAHPEIPASFGQLLEVSWAGGFGSATGMGAVYASQGFAEGRDLVYFLATVGLVYGVLSGLVFVNLAIRRGWTATSVDELSAKGGSEKNMGAPPLAGIMEPAAVGVVILAISFALGIGLQQAFATAIGHVIRVVNHSPRQTEELMKAVENIPLFLFTLLAGAIVRRALTGLGLSKWIDINGIQRLIGIAMEFLIVAGVATMKLDAVGRFGWPLLLLLAGAMAWSVVCLFWISPRLLPRKYWFELGLLNFGFSTANTPQGMMLLRIVDPELKTGAATDYAVAAPLSAPFIGGGIVTFLLLPWALQTYSAGAVLAILLTSLAGLYVAGRRLSRGFEGDAVEDFTQRQSDAQ